MKIDPKLDLKIQLELDITPEQAFKGWTTPELYGKWFCPEPWKVVDARLDLRPGGEFYTVMQSPEGEKFPGTGCILEVIPNQKLVWTSALGPDFRPAKQTSEHDLPFTAIIYFEAKGNKTLYTAIGRHGTEEARKKHEEMGFEQGWTICAQQLERMMKSL